MIDNSGIKVMSYNIAIWHNGSNSNHDWHERGEYVLFDIMKTEPDLIGFQEVGPEQYHYLQQKLTAYSSVITYRDGQNASEACPIFFKSDKFNLIDQNTFWLSETPNIMSRDWNSAYYRICTYVILEHRFDKQWFAFYNTHLDNISEIARVNGIKLIIEKSRQNKLPMIITGDFNTSNVSETYHIATENLLDTCVIAHQTTNGVTYQNWGQTFDFPKIDYIFVSHEFTTQLFQIVANTHAGHYASDHFAIYAELNWQ